MDVKRKMIMQTIIYKNKDLVTLFTSTHTMIIQSSFEQKMITCKIFNS